MSRTATFSLAVGLVTLGLSFSAANATPAFGTAALVGQSSGAVQKVQFRCVRRCLRHSDLPPWACRRRCFAGSEWGGFGGDCIRRCVIRTNLPPWACRRRCFGGLDPFDGHSGFGYEHWQADWRTAHGGPG